MAKVTIKVDKSAEQHLEDRTRRLKPTGPPSQLTPFEQAVQFLRGVYSRSTVALPAFYLFQGAKAQGEPRCAIEGYPGLVLKHSLEFLSIGTISLAARKAFDHDPKKLTGANFAKNSDETLMEVAEYWSKKSARSVQNAFAALCFLRVIFRNCSKTESDLFNTLSPFGQRIALLKQYANRSAAHLSLENYEFSTLDCVHVVAALTVIGEIIRSFDLPDSEADYFDTLDEASLVAARQLFPAIPDLRLFDGIKIEAQSRFCWQDGIENGKQMLFEQLPYAIGWF